jgi:hypothetical protein
MATSVEQRLPCWERRRRLGRVTSRAEQRHLRRYLTLGGDHQSTTQVEKCYRALARWLLAEQERHRDKGCECFATQGELAQLFGR